MKANISPLPWRCDGTKIIAKSQMVGDDRDRLVVDLAPGTGMSVDGTKAVASYIVQACNAYPKLVEALKTLPLERFGEDMGNHDAAEFVDNAGRFFEAMKLAKVALADAGEEL